LSTKVVGCSNNPRWSSFLLALLQRLFPSLLLCNGSGEEYEKTGEQESRKAREGKRRERREGRKEGGAVPASLCALAMAAAAAVK
jgi:hypothetical protein